MFYYVRKLGKCFRENCTEIYQMHPNLGISYLHQRDVTNTEYEQQKLPSQFGKTILLFFFFFCNVEFRRTNEFSGTTTTKV